MKGGVTVIANFISTCRNMNIHFASASKAMQRISSGYRINSASDDPAGLQVSDGMRAQIRGIQQASRNAQNGISAIQVADGALNETQSILQRMRELAVKASNGVCTTEDRKNMQLEINQLTSEVNTIGTNTEFNTMKLLDSSAAKYDSVNHEIQLQVGASSGQTIKIQLGDMKSKSLNISGNAGAIATSQDGSTKGKFSTTKCQGSTDYALDVSTSESASAAIKIYGDAIGKVSCLRGALGATENLLEYKITYLDSVADGLSGTESRIRDADIAKESMQYSKENILCQASQKMFVQTNRQSDSILQLLKLL